MLTIGAFEAKTHFSQLLQKVDQGESVVITKHGVKIAMLVPIQEENTQAGLAVDRIRELRKGVTLGKELTLKQLREMGRK